MCIRTFIAFELSPESQSKLRAIQDKLKKSGADVRWVKPENIHLTLKFLGYVSALQLKDVFAATDESIKGIAPFPLSFSRLGAFPRLNNPRVVWVGVKEGEETLSRIKESLERILKRNGFPQDGREYHPHLTLGRVKSSRNRDELVEAVKSEKDCFVGSIEAKKITIIQSILKPEGPEYKPLHVSEMKPQMNTDTIATDIH